MDWQTFQQLRSRRKFLANWAAGLGVAALHQLFQCDGLAASPAQSPGDNPLAPKAPQFPARAKSVIFLFMDGAPSQLDLFDPKPEMRKWNNQPLPESMRKGLRFAFIKPTARIWASPRIFQAHGQSGIEFSDYLPHLAGCADEIAVIRSMFSEQFNHHPGQLMLQCGTPLVGRPSMGAWVLYGLGSESQSLPGFIVLNSGHASSASSGIFSSGFLPSLYQGVPFRNTGDPVLHLSDPPGYSREDQRDRLAALHDLNQRHYEDTGDFEVASRMASYELAFRMQMAAPETLDLSKESPATLDSYGVNQETTRTFGTNCLLARRLVERGVRFVMLSHGSWDDHSHLNQNLKKNCDITDRPIAALIQDLKQRGLLESTLVVWGGEFGRTPLAESVRTGEEDSLGRDHHPSAFTMWMAGGGIKGGQVVGKTDDFCLNIAEDKVHIHDLHATVLHCLGLQHERLTYFYQGRHFRLTDVAGNVVHKLLS